MESFIEYYIYEQRNGDILGLGMDDQKHKKMKFKNVGYT